MAAFDSADPLILAKRVVVVDACSMLDIIRIPDRVEWVADATSVQAILDAASDPARLILAMPARVKGEFETHRHGKAVATLNMVRSQAKELRATADRLEQMQRRCNISTVDLPAVITPTTDWPDALCAKFKALANSVVAVITEIPRDLNDEALAMDRTAVRRPPAGRGSSVNDSVLCETALRLAGQRAAKTTGLLTSNDKDFRKAKVLHPELVAEYDAAGLVDLRSWGDASNFIHIGLNP